MSLSNFIHVEILNKKKKIANSLQKYFWFGLFLLSEMVILDDFKHLFGSCSPLNPFFIDFTVLFCIV